ncbi:hypothetical protein [Candidatus Poriferisodalis sp.]
MPDESGGRLPADRCPSPLLRPSACAPTVLWGTGNELLTPDPVVVELVVA